jgi:hypothetical protein
MIRNETELQLISRKTGRKVSYCKCKECKQQCKTAGLGTPLEMQKIIDAGLGHRLMPSVWGVGIARGFLNRTIDFVAPEIIDGHGCTFFVNGLCQLHDLGLKPMECRLSHHSVTKENFDYRKSLSYNIIKLWEDFDGLDKMENDIKR